MNFDVSSGSDSDAYVADKWICDTCKRTPVNANVVDFQCQCSEKVLYADDNGETWVRCRNCDRHYHVKCVKNLPPDVCECFFRSCGWNVYVCAKCF